MLKKKFKSSKISEDQIKKIVGIFKNNKISEKIIILIKKTKSPIELKYKNTLKCRIGVKDIFYIISIQKREMF